MTTSLACENPKCICNPCSCDECRCSGPRLGDLERQVMGIVWDRPATEVTGRDVFEALPGYAYTTVATVLDRLSNKGYLRRRTERRVVRYSAADSSDDHTATAMRDILEKATDSTSALVRFAQIVTRSEAEVLQDELNRRRRVVARSQGVRTRKSR